MSDRDRIGELERLALLSYAAGRGRHFGGGPLFGGGRGRRRRGDVRISVLLLLAEEPRNGYQLMQLIEERSQGRWRPSPGSVYPTLAQLEDEGLIRATEQDGAKLFELTDRGRQHLASHGRHEAPWADDEDEDATGGARTELRALLHSLHLAVLQMSRVGDEEQIGRTAQLLEDTRRGVYRILAGDDQPVTSERDA